VCLASWPRGESRFYESAQWQKDLETIEQFLSLNSKHKA